MSLALSLPADVDLCSVDHFKRLLHFSQAKGKLPQKGYVDNVDNGKFLDTAPTVAALAS